MHLDPLPLVSVIVVNWNRRELLRAALGSLARQQGVAFEVIVVDNGSSDGSAEMVAEEFTSSGGAPVQLIRNRENRGFCAANNQGIALARGEFVALLNNDAEADARWLDALSRAFQGRGDVGMAASKILVYEDPRLIDKAGHLIYLDGQNRGRGMGLPDDGRYDRLEEALWPDGCAAMYRKQMLEQIGGFDEDFFAYGDDAELGLRARIAGWKCLYVPEAVVRHHRGATLGRESTRRLELIERNRVLLAVKLFPGSLLWRNWLYYLARLVAGVWASMRGAEETSRFPGWRGKLRMAGALVRGDVQALWITPRMWRKRREVQKIRKLSPRDVRQLLEQYRMPLGELLK
ncbi:MAG TPA: glycosyltransferase family 2 protein [Bryobacteraceae bacterium]|nr:glycosyltransferase family 2 protein [Bryobacteraceae bacterium]